MSEIEQNIITELTREKDRLAAEFAACKALLIAAQQRAERAEAERAEAEAERAEIRKALHVACKAGRQSEEALATAEQRASEARALALREAAELCDETGPGYYPWLAQRIRDLAALPIEPARDAELLRTCAVCGYGDGANTHNPDAHAAAGVPIPKGAQTESTPEPYGRRGMRTCPSCNEWVSEHHLCPVAGAASRSERGASCQLHADCRAADEVLGSDARHVPGRLEQRYYEALADADRLASSEHGEDSGNGPKAQVAPDAGRKLVAEAKALHEKYAPLAAGPAAQSPQVGAEEENRFPEGSAGELAETVVAWADFSLAHLNEHEPTYWLKNLRLVGSKWLREHAEPGRSTSDRPPESSPVASADPELAALREEVARLTGILDSILSRLAGQSAPVANESGGAARGSPEEGT